jgi:DNA-binding SARP family transcriptional activator
VEKLRILLLGPPAVYEGDKLIQIQRRIVRSILFYLACQKRMVARSELILLFWSEDLQGRQHLREALSKLREDLPDSTLLIAEQDMVGLDEDRVEVDVIEFNRLNELCRRAARSKPIDQPLPAGVIKQINETLNLWRSPHFLAGSTPPDSEAFENWQSQIGQELEFARHSLLLRMADHYAATGDLEYAIQWIRMALEVDEFDFEAHYRMVNWLHKLGRDKEALAHYQNVRKFFQQEGFGEVSPALQDLYQKISKAVSSSNTSDSSEWTNPPTSTLAFVGNDQAMENLRLSYQRGGMVVLWGELGSGKTRLAYEFYRSLQPEPRLFLTKARPMEDSLPFQPFIDLLRHTIQQKEWDRLTPVWGSLLVTLLPELVTTYPKFNVASNESHEARHTMFEAIRQILLIAAENRRIIFFLDDAMWCDEASLSTLAYLAGRHYFSEHGLLLLAVRPEKENFSLENFLESIQWSGMAIRMIRLEPLSIDQVEELVRNMVGRTPPNEVIERLAKESGGNPLYLLELMHAFMEYLPESELPDSVNLFPLPSSIHALIRERLRNLSLQARQVLTVAAVIGSEFSADVIEITSQMTIEQVVQILEELEANHFIRSVSGGTTNANYIYAHDRIREVLLLEISAARQRMLHLRIAQALETRSNQSPIQASILAQHFEAAGELHSAFHHWVQAGQQARLISKADAYQAFQHAEKLAIQLEHALTDAEIYQFYSTWGELADDVSDIERMGQIYQKMLKVGRDHNDLLLIGSGLSGLAKQAIYLGSFDAGLTQLEHAIPLLDQTYSQYERIKANVRLAYILSKQYKYNEGAQASLRSIELGKNSLDEKVIDLIGTAEYQLFTFYEIRGLPLKMTEVLDRYLLLPYAGFMTLRSIRRNLVEATYDYNFGRYQEAKAHCVQGLRNSNEMHISSMILEFLILTARCEYHLGLLDESWEHIKTALAESQNFQLADFYLRALVIQGDIYLSLLDFSKAQETYQKALDGDSKDPYHRLEAMIRAARAARVLGDIERSDNLLVKAHDDAHKADYGNLYLYAELVQANFLVERGEMKPAQEIFEEVLRQSEERQLYPTQLWANSAYGNFLMLNNNFDKAIQYGRKTVDQSQKCKMVWTELSGQATLNRLKDKVSPNDGSQKPKERIYEILDYMEGNTRHEEIIPMFASFRRQMLKEAEED